MDAEALSVLNEMGYGGLTGFKVERTLDHDCIEQFTEHALNASFAGRRRDGRQSFWHSPAYAFAPSVESCRPLARIIDYARKEVAPCCIGVFENELGGRVCVAGYYPWTQLHSLSKASQIKAVMRWLARDALPAYIGSFHRVNLWARVRDGGGIALALLNASLDPAERIELCVLTSKDTLRVTDMQCRDTRVTAIQSDAPYKRFALPSIQPWGMCLLRTE
jgi:hypothetical protein